MDQFQDLKYTFPSLYWHDIALSQTTQVLQCSVEPIFWPQTNSPALFFWSQKFMVTEELQKEQWNKSERKRKQHLSISYMLGHTTYDLNRNVVWLLDALRTLRYGSSSGSVWAVWVKIFFPYWFHRTRISIACPGLKSRQ